MTIKTTLLKVVTSIIDVFTFLFAVIFVLGLYSSISEHTVFFLQILTDIGLFSACLLIFGISFYLFRIYKLIDQHNFFSQIALHFVRTVRYLFIAISVALLLILPFIVYGVREAGAPGLLIIALAVVFLPTAIAAFISVMEKILINSINFKDENELTI